MVIRLAVLDRKLVRDMWRMRGHLAAVALVALCGAATLITMRGAYESLVDARARYYRDYHFANVFARAKRVPQPMIERIARIPGVAAVEDRVVSQVRLEVAGFPDPVIATVVSVPDARRPVLNNVHIRTGRYVAAGSADEVLVNEGFAEAHRLKPGDHLNAAINGRWQRLRIVGVAGSPEFIYVLGGAAMLPDDRRNAVLWMGRKALAASLDLTDAFNDVAVALAPNADEKRVLRELDLLLDPYGATASYNRADQLSHQFVDSEIKQDRVTGMIVPSIFLGVAAFLIHNVLLRLVALQRAQIGVLKAFGYRDRSVAMHYLKLAVAAVMTGCIGGIAVGAWFGEGLAEIYQRFFRFPVLEFRLSAAGIAIVIAACAAAAIAGALPAILRALALPPAEAMRPEAPLRFRPLLLERLGYVRLLAPAIRMIFRNLERRPLRAAASVLAMALSCALLVVGRFGLDAVDETVRVQFRAGRRDDVRVAFNEPRGPAVKQELEHLPGALEVETLRTAPVRLRHGYRSKRIAVFGLPRDAELHRVLDIRMREVPLPADGVVLGASLAETLHAVPGSLVTMEFLTGQRRVRQVRVAATVEEPVGQFAYMDIDVLARLLGEGVTVSDAYLRVDKTHLDELYDRLKGLPAVQGIALREATLRSFLDTIAENLTTSMMILMWFAGLIAGGVVYNGARIALSEHAVSLASLRILGFTRREVGTILLGEQAVLVVLSIPVGFALGYAICAWLVTLLAAELYRLPLVVSTRTYLYSSGLVLTAAIASGLLVGWRLRHLDLVAVLKTRE